MRQNLKIRDKRNKKKINFRKGNKLTEFDKAVPLQKSKYYNMITINYSKKKY